MKKSKTHAKIENIYESSGWLFKAKNILYEKTYTLQQTVWAISFSSRLFVNEFLKMFSHYCSFQTL